jgi:cytochrome P450
MFREHFGQEELGPLPQVTFGQCMTLTGVTIVLLGIYAFHLSQQLSMISMKMPIVVNSWSSLPYFGQVPLFLTNSPWDLLLRWHNQYGPVFCFVLMGRTCVSVAHPDYLKVALQSKIRSVKKDVAFSYKPFLVILGKGIVSSENTAWMKQRLKMSTALRIDVLDMIPGITLQAVQRLYKTLDAATQTGDKVALGESLRHLTLQVISSSFLSLSAEESDSTFAHFYLPIVDECNKRVWHPERAYMWFMPFFWKHLYYVHRLNSYVSSLIWNRWNQRRAGQEPSGDMLDRVLDQYEKEFPNQPLTKSAAKQFRDEMKTFMLAGHETSAAMMTWCFYELMGNASLLNQVVTEAESVFGTSDWNQVDTSALPPREELSNLVLSEGCLKEALRKYAVVPMVTRQVVEPIEFGPHSVPAGTTLLIAMNGVHHDPSIWPDPMTFDPHRFTSDTRPAPYTFLPFIEGPRNCLGQHLALLESKMVVALVLQRFELKMEKAIVSELNGSDSDPRHRYMVPIIPKHEIYVTCTRRKKQSS